VGKRFDERWIETAGAPFEFEGRLVHPIFRRTVEPGTEIDVEFIASRATPAQGLQLKTRGALLAWEEHQLEGESVRLWADKQRRATLRYVNPRKGAELTIWNIWLDERSDRQSQDPVVQAWWAWSGMVIEEAGPVVLLRCSGSYDGPDFDDLTVRIVFRPG
jgi:hypothetical protein